MNSANVGHPYALVPVELTMPDLTSGYHSPVDVETAPQLFIQRAIIILSVLCIVVGGFLTTL